MTGKLDRSLRGSAVRRQPRLGVASPDRANPLYSVGVCCAAEWYLKICGSLQAVSHERWDVSQITIPVDGVHGECTPELSAIDALVFDATSLLASGADEDRITAFFGSLRQALSPPLVMLACLTHDARKNRMLTDGIVALARRLVPFELVLAWPDGEAIDWREPVERAVLTRLSARVIVELLTAAPALDERIRWLLCDLFRRPEHYRSADHVMRALEVALTIQRVDKLLSQAGLASFEKLRRVARVARSHEMLWKCGWTVAKVVRRLGYGSDDTLSADIKRVAGVTPGDWRRQFRDRPNDGSEIRSLRSSEEIHQDVVVKRAVRYCLYTP